MWMPKRTSPWVTPVLSPALPAPAPGAPGVGAGAGAGPPAEPDADEAAPAAFRAPGWEPEAAAWVAAPPVDAPPEALAPAGVAVEAAAVPPLGVAPPVEAAADAPAVGVAEASDGPGAGEPVLPPDGVPALDVLPPPGRRDAAPLVSLPPPPQAVRVRTRAAKSDTPRTEVFIVVLPLSPDGGPLGPQGRELRCVDKGEFAFLARAPPAGERDMDCQRITGRRRTGP